MKNILAVLLLAVTSLWTVNSWSHDPALHGFKLTTFDPPFPAPDFDLATLTDEQSSLADQKGSYILLNFWATWCPPCLKEMPSMEVVHQRYKERGFTVLAISSDEGGKADIDPFIEKLDVTFPILIDSDKAVSSIYGASNLPLTLILNREGQVIAGAEGERDWASEEAISVLDEIIEPQ